MRVYETIFSLARNGIGRHDWKYGWASGVANSLSDPVVFDPITFFRHPVAPRVRLEIVLYL